MTVLAGDEADADLGGRGWVYFTEVQNMPVTDMVGMVLLFTTA
jgi:hypothetical protein